MKLSSTKLKVFGGWIVVLMCIMVFSSKVLGSESIPKERENYQFTERSVPLKSGKAQVRKYRKRSSRNPVGIINISKLPARSRIPTPPEESPRSHQRGSPSSGASSDHRRKGACHADRGACRVDRTREVGLRRGIHAKAARNAWDLARREHKPHAHERMVLEYHESRHKNGRLEEGRQAQPDDLPRPAGKAVQITARHAEHIERADCDLNEQNAAALEVGKKYFNDRVGHKNDTKEQHDGAGQCAESEV